MTTSDPLPQWLIDTIHLLPRDQQGTALGFAAAGYVAGRASASPREAASARVHAAFEAGSMVQAERASGFVYVDPHPADLEAR